MRNTKHQIVARLLKTMDESKYCFDELYQWFVDHYGRESVEKADIIQVIDRMFVEMDTLLNFIDEN